MFDIKWLREHAEEFDLGLARRGLLRPLNWSGWTTSAAPPSLP